MSRILGSLFITAILFRDAFRHHESVSYLLVLGVFLFVVFGIEVIRAILEALK